MNKVDIQVWNGENRLFMWVVFKACHFVKHKRCFGTVFLLCMLEPLKKPQNFRVRSGSSLSSGICVQGYTAIQPVRVPKPQLRCLHSLFLFALLSGCSLYLRKKSGLTFVCGSKFFLPGFVFPDHQVILLERRGDTMNTV